MEAFSRPVNAKLEFYWSHGVATVGMWAWVWKFPLWHFDLYPTVHRRPERGALEYEKFSIYPVLKFTRIHASDLLPWLREYSSFIIHLNLMIVPGPHRIEAIQSLIPKRPFLYKDRALPLPRNRLFVIETNSHYPLIRQFHSLRQQLQSIQATGSVRRQPTQLRIYTNR